MSKLFFITAVAVTLFSCNTATNKTGEATATKTATLEDSLYQQVMDIHNELMPKMGKLKGYQAQAQKQIDSIKAIISSTTYPAEVTRRIADDGNKLDILNDSLKAAEGAMNDWMDGFDGDPQMKTTQERAAYFADQKQKAEIMRNRFLNAYQKAEQFFATPGKP
jgi:hypothetical protein